MTDAPPQTRFINLSALRYQTCGCTDELKIVCWGKGRFSETHHPWALHAPAPSWQLIVGRPILDPAGDPHTISLELELDLYDGDQLDTLKYPPPQLALTFIATVLDERGDPVAEGTPVSWEIAVPHGPQMVLLDEDAATSGGKARTRILLLGPEPFTVVTRAGETEARMPFPPPHDSTLVRWSTVSDDAR